MQINHIITADAPIARESQEKPPKAKDSGKLMPCNPPEEFSSSRTQVLTQESERIDISEVPFGPRFLPTFIQGKVSDSKVPSIDDFVIQKEIGSGAFAKVRLAYLPETKTYFAAKIYSKSSLQQPFRYSSLQSEIKILRQIDHPNIVKLKYVLESSSELYLMLEYVQGVPLNDYLRRLPNRKCSEGQAKFIFKELMNAIAYCHSQNICHRDIKLENVLIDSHDHVKLIDFGFSTCFDKNKKVKMFCGTLSYMATEIVQKVEYAGPPADVWACGVLLYALVSGSFPFKAAFSKEVIHRIYIGQFQLPPEFTPRLRNLVLSMMNSNPDDRPTANQVLSDPWLCNTGNEYTKFALECEFKRVCVKGTHLFEKFPS